MSPKRPAAAAASGSASDASEGEACQILRPWIWGCDKADAAHHPSSPSPSKTPPPNPNPKSAASSSNPASASVAADTAAAGSDSGGAYDSDADADHRPAPKATSPKPRGGNPKPPSPGVNSDYDISAALATSDADPDPDPVAGAYSDDDNASPLPPPRPSRAEAAAIKPISSRPMDPPRRSVVASEPRAKRPRSAAVGVASSAEQMKRPSRLWSPGDELVILRGLIAYRAKRGALPGSTLDIGKLHGHIRSQLSVKVTTTQLSDKVRRLKQKYQLLATRAKNGRDQDLPTPHDHSIYELAKKVWGARSGDGGGGGAYDNAGGGESEEQYSGEKDDDMESERDDRDHKNRRLGPVTVANGNGIRIGAANANGRGKSEFDKGKDAYPYLWETVEDLSREHPSGMAFKKAFEVLEGSKARVMEERLRKFRLTEIRQQLRGMDLMKETVKIVLDALERAD